MKFQAPFSGSGRASSRASSRGFTLTEILIAVAVFMILLAGIISANLFGLKMFQLNQAKLTATDWSRRTFGKITDEVHACNSVSILNVDTNGNFTGLIDGEAQQGNALEIFPTQDTNNSTIYFVNLPDQTFRRTELTPGGTNTFILADSVTNAVIFTAQDIFGQIQTNTANTRLIHLVLEFYQPETFMQRPDYYRLETSVTRRALQ
jgi:prepilin-type N-terminal cleavage/methylation domain-containing protein